MNQATGTGDGNRTRVSCLGSHGYPSNYKGYPSIVTLCIVLGWTNRVLRDTAQA